MVSWLSALEEEPKNPWGIAMRAFGGATALVARDIAVSPVFNRVIGFGPEQVNELDAIVRF